MDVGVATGRQGKPRLGQVGMVVDQRYRLDELIGSGGFGEVWRATQQVEGQPVRAVALKILAAPGGAGTGPEPPATAAAGSSAGDGGGWLNEVRAIREVSCDAIATIYDVGIARDPRVAFIAMELLEGTTLDGRLGGGPIYWRRALAIARDVAVALETCHAVEVAHCDLKPPNIFLSSGGRVCVLDFGIAALGAAGQSAAAPREELGADFATGAVDTGEVPGAIAPDVSFRLVGTPGYIAPEGYGGEPPGPAADVFALGVVLYEMIAGRLPYDLPPDVPTRETATTRGDYDRYRAAINLATTRGDYTALSEVVPDVPPAVDALVMRLLSIDPATRPTSDLRAAIDEAWKRPYGVPDPPYVGLEAFSLERAGFMYGRQADVREITRKLAGSRAVVLSGPSGCGKSSLAGAGVGAQIDQELLADRDGWKTVVVRPTETGALEPAGDPEAGERPAVGTLVVLDQLEEVLSLPEERRERISRALADLALGTGAIRVAGQIIGADHDARLVATVRDDLFGRVAALPELRRFPEQNLYTVRGVEPNAIPDIVTGPAAAAGYRLEGEDAVIGEATRVLSGDPSALPLVQFALTRWWEQRDEAEKVLPAASWNDIGGIEGALADAASQVYDALDPDGREHMRALLIELFRADGTRVRVPEDRVATSAGARRVLERLIEQRLVRRQSDDNTLEVVHEALARRWQPLRHWLEETRAERELIQDAAYDADRWSRAGKPLDMLWRGGRLAQALELEGRLGDAAEFIAASQRQTGRSRRRRRALVTAAFAVLVAFVIGLVLAYLDSNAARRQAENQKTEAERAREAAVAAQKKAERAQDRAEAEREKAVQALAARDQARRERDEVEIARKEAEEEKARADKERSRAMDLAARLTKQAREIELERDKAQRAQQEALTAAREARTQRDRAVKAEAEARKALRELRARERELKRLREKDGVGDLPVGDFP